MKEIKKSNVSLKNVKKSFAANRDARIGGGHREGLKKKKSYHVKEKVMIIFISIDEF